MKILRKKARILPAKKPLVALFTFVLLSLVLMPTRRTLAETGSITVNAQKVVRLRPFGVGGTNIANHKDGVNFVNGKNGINFQTDAQMAKLPLIRVLAYPDDRSPIDIDFSDTKVKAILSSSAQPLFGSYIGSSVDSNQPTGSSVSPYYNLDGTTVNGTLATNIVYMVKRYMAPPYNLQQQYWEIGNEPNTKIDGYATPQIYSQIFNSVHTALVTAGLRDHVILMGPVLSSGYNGNYLDAFMAHSGQYVDIIDYHNYTGAGNDLALLNTPHKFDIFYDALRHFDVNAGLSIFASDQANADYGDAALLYRMDRVPFGRPNVGTALTEHNGYTQPQGGHDVHSIASGLYNLAVTHFMLYNPRGQVDNSFVYDQVCNDQGYAHYDCNNQRDYSWYALYIRNNYTGPFVLEQSTTGNLNGSNNSSGNPYLFVTATRDDSYMYVEVINRNTNAPIKDPVVLNGVHIAGNATVYTMANNILPNPGNGKVYGVSNNFTYTFPAESATIFQIPITPLTDFVVTATAVSQMVNPGHTTTYMVTSTPTGGFAGDVSLSVSGLPPQSSASFSAPTVQGAGNSIMSVVTNPTTPNGDYPLTVAGTTSNGVLHNYKVMLRVATPEFDLSSDKSVSVGTGKSATIQTTVVPKGGFADIVNFSVSGLPGGVTLDPATLDSGGPLKLTFRASTAVAPGSYPVTINASSTTLQHSSQVMLKVF